jgi:hypothetical protein
MKDLTVLAKRSLKRSLKQQGLTAGSCKPLFLLVEMNGEEPKPPINLKGMTLLTFQVRYFVE